MGRGLLTTTKRAANTQRKCLSLSRKKKKGIEISIEIKSTKT